MKKHLSISKFYIVRPTQNILPKNIFRHYSSFKSGVSNTRPSRIFCAARDKLLDLKVNYKKREELKSLKKKLLVCFSAIPVRILTLCSNTADPVASRVTDLAANVEKQLVKKKINFEVPVLKNAVSRVARAINDCSSSIVTI